MNLKLDFSNVWPLNFKLKRLDKFLSGQELGRRGKSLFFHSKCLRLWGKSCPCLFRHNTHVLFVLLSTATNAISHYYKWILIDFSNWPFRTPKLKRLDKFLTGQELGRRGKSLFFHSKCLRLWGKSCPCLFRHNTHVLFVLLSTATNAISHYYKWILIGFFKRRTFQNSKFKRLGNVGDSRQELGSFVLRSKSLFFHSKCLRLFCHYTQMLFHTATNEFKIGFF